MDIKERTRGLIHTLANGAPSLDYIGSELDAIARAWLVAQGGSLQEYEALTKRGKHESFPDWVCTYARSYDEIEGTDPETHHCFENFIHCAKDGFLIGQLDGASIPFGYMCEAKLEKRLGPLELRNPRKVHVIDGLNENPTEQDPTEAAKRAEHDAWCEAEYRGSREKLQDALISFLPHIESQCAVEVPERKPEMLSDKLDAGIVREVVLAYETDRIKSFEDYKKVTKTPPTKLIGQVKEWKLSEEQESTIKILQTIQGLRSVKRKPRS